MANISGFEDLSCQFPLSIDPNRNFVDVGLDNISYVEQYETYIQNKDFDSATALMQSQPSLKNIIINASVIQLLYDMNIAEQRVYKSDIQTLIGQVVKYKGVYSTTTTYSMFNIVTYNFKAYMCISSSTPVGTLPTDSTYWILETIQGEAGIGLTPYTTYDSTVTYNNQAVVPWSNKLYMSLQNNNLNHQPDVSPTWWKVVFTNATQIITSSTQPTSQEAGDLWYEVLS